MQPQLKFFLLLLSILFSLQSCGGKPDSLNKKDCVLEKFFKYLMLCESGIYTLAGTKPITGFWVFSHSEGEKRSHWDNLSNEEKSRRILIINRDKKEDVDFLKTLPKKLRKKAILVQDKDYLIDLEIFVTHWELIKKTPVSNRYLLIGREEYQDLYGKKEKVFRVLFVNILETALAIQENYSLFRDFVGFDFDPVSVVMELKNDNSEFWGKIKGKESSTLWGIMYGFGKKNSFCYSWESKYNFLNGLTSDEFFLIPSLKNFSIPIFASFSKTDPVVEKYKKEREMIQKEYQGKNFLKHTLELMNKP